RTARSNARSPAAGPAWESESLEDCIGAIRIMGAAPPTWGICRGEPGQDRLPKDVSAARGKLVSDGGGKKDRSPTPATLTAATRAILVRKRPHALGRTGDTVNRVT